MMSDQNDGNIIRMVDRACVILEYLYNMDSSASISALAKELELPKANVYRILYTMQQHGIIEKENETDLYRLGKELIKYGEKVSYDSDLVDLASVFMKSMAERLGETINIGIEHEGSIVTLHSEEGEKTVLVSRLIPVAELHCSSMGKLILAEMEKADLKKYFTQKLTKRTVNTIVDFNNFEKEKEKILSENLAYDHEEYDYGLSCIAVPIRNKSKEIVAMVSVSGPTTRLEYKGMSLIVKSIKELASQIEKEWLFVK